MAYTSFFDTSSTAELSITLVERNQNIVWISTLILVISFFIIAMARMASREFLMSLGKSVYKNNQVDRIVQEEYPLNSPASFLLLINFFLVVGGNLNLFLLHQGLQLELHQLFWLLIPPGVYFLWSWFSMKLTILITGEKSLFVFAKLNLLIFLQLGGVLLSLSLLIWAFNPSFSAYFSTIFLGIMGFILFFRIYRGIVEAFQQGISWYYIILYFCTFEILPYYLLLQVFWTNF
jgi:hypothetical protein